MKLLYTIILITLFGSGISHAQMITVTDATASNCDGTAYFNAWSSYSSAVYTCNWYQDSTLINTGDSLIINLCSGNYQFELDSAGTIIYSTTFNIDNPCSGFYIYTSTTNTEVNACTGSITITPVGGAGPYVYSWSNGTTTQSLTNLCIGAYSITCIDANGCSATTTAIVGDNDSTNYLYLNLSITDDADGNCSGAASISPTGGTAPYSAYWSNGDATYSVSNLCAGIYSVTVWDAAGDTTTNTFVITDPSSTYGNNPYTDSIPVGDLYGDLIENCTIDYSTIDSASLASAIYDSVSQNLYVTWVIYSENGGVTTLYDTLGLSGQSGIYTISITVYCPAKSIDQYFKIVGGVYLHADGTLSVEENNIFLFSPYPNPFAENISLKNTTGLNCHIHLIDATGRIVLTEQSNAKLIQLNNLSDLNAGTYFLNVETDKGSKIWKLVK